MTAPTILDRPRAASPRAPHAGPVEPSTGRGPSAAPVSMPPRPAPDWSGAACADQPHLPWVPATPAGEDAVVSALAQVCADCPIRAACLAWALDCGEVGIWGGLTTAQRRERAARAGEVAAGRCKVAGCDRLREGRRSMCSAHAARARRGTDMDAPHARPGPLAVSPELIPGGWIVTGPCGGRHLEGRGFADWSCPVCAARRVS